MNNPIIKKPKQPLAHFIYGGTPYREDIKANTENRLPSTKDIKVIAYKGSLSLLFNLNIENRICKAGATNIKIKGITNKNIIIKN